MKQETKDLITAVGSTAFTVGTSTMLGWAAGWGSIALANAVFKDGLTRGQLKLFGSVICVGSVGVGYLVAQDTYPTDPSLLDLFKMYWMYFRKEVNDADT